LGAIVPSTMRDCQDVAQELASLSVADKYRLQQAAKIYAKIGGTIEPHDLLMDAQTKAISGERQCRSDMALVPFLRGVMKSLASNHNEKDKRRREAGHQEVQLPENDLFSLADIQTPTPEQALVDAERDAAFQAFLLKACNDCRTTLAVLQATFDGLKGSALCEAAGVTQQELPTILRRIKRMMSRFETKGVDHDDR